MGAPETIHLGKKFGFEVALDIPYTNALLAYAIGAKDDWEGTHDLQGLDED